MATAREEKDQRDPGKLLFSFARLVVFSIFIIITAFVINGIIGSYYCNENSYFGMLIGGIFLFVLTIILIIFTRISRAQNAAFRIRKYILFISCIIAMTTLACCSIYHDGSKFWIVGNQTTHKSRFIIGIPFFHDIKGINKTRKFWASTDLNSTIYMNARFSYSLNLALDDSNNPIITRIKISSGQIKGAMSTLEQKLIMLFKNYIQKKSLADIEKNIAFDQEVIEHINNECLQQVGIEWDGILTIEYCEIILTEKTNSQ